MASSAVLPHPQPAAASMAPVVPTSITSKLPVSAQAPPTFEFMRRKRWADLLINELSEGIIFVLSHSGKVLFCSHSVYELLGWRDEELVDRDIFDWMQQADRDTFRACLSDCSLSDRDMQAYARLSCKPDQPLLMIAAPSPPSVLFEFLARPHIVPGEHIPRCIFAVAKPTPSRNTAMLNAFLELKIENARLQSRVRFLKSQALTGVPSGPSGAVSEHSLQAAVDSRDPAAYYAALGAVGSSNAPSHSHSGLIDDADGAPHKRRRTAVEPHVCTTCGRTDSPEWRKGPRGPKTLCNACGLRWAKKVRKYEENGGEGVAEPLDDVVPP